MKTVSVYIKEVFNYKSTLTKTHDLLKSYTGYFM